MVLLVHFRAQMSLTWLKNLAFGQFLKWQVIISPCSCLVVCFRGCWRARFIHGPRLSEWMYELPSRHTILLIFFSQMKGRRFLMLYIIFLYEFQCFITETKPETIASYMHGRWLFHNVTGNTDLARTPHVLKRESPSLDRIISILISWKMTDSWPANTELHKLSCNSWLGSRIIPYIDWFQF